MDDDLAIAPVSMVEFYQTIGLTANGTVPESFNKRDATEYPNIISNITTKQPTSLSIFSSSNFKMTSRQ